MKFPNSITTSPETVETIRSYKIKEWIYEDQPTRAAFNLNGNLIGPVEFAQMLHEAGFINFRSAKERSDCNTAFLPSEGKWYEWNPNAFALGEQVVIQEAKNAFRATKVVLDIQMDINLIRITERLGSSTHEYYLTPDGFFIGNEQVKSHLLNYLGLSLLQPHLPYGPIVCSIGFSEREQKWYGWSHRGARSIGIGDTYETESFETILVQSLEEAKEKAKELAESLSSSNKENNMKKPQISRVGSTSRKSIEIAKCADEKRSAIEHNSECNLWLPAAAKEYQISPRLEDYVLVTVPAMIVGLPNTNGDSVSLSEFLRFQPENGMQTFKTFRGKPTYVEHDNQVITKAKGVILDVYLRPVKKFGNGKYWKLVMLTAWDRTKDPQLVKSILSGEDNAYSIGFYYRSFECSICGHLCGGKHTQAPCKHTRLNQPTYREGNRLGYRKCSEVVGFECSSVGSPAFLSAVSDNLMDARSYLR